MVLVTSGTHRGESASWNAGEVMVLVVVANVKGEQVQRTVVRIRLVAFEEHVVLGDEVSGDGVQAHAQQGSSKHVHNRLGPQSPVQQHVKGHLKDDVGYLQLTNGLGIDAERSDSVEKWLQDYPDELAEACAEEPSLQLGGNIHIHSISAQVAMMVQVIALERCRIGEADGQVGKHGKVAVPHGLVVSKSRVVGDLVNGEGHRVVDAAAKSISPKQNPFPAQIFDQVKGTKLHGHHEAHNPL